MLLALLEALCAQLISRFQNFAADAVKNYTVLVFWNRASRSFNQLIKSNEFGAKDSEKLFYSLEGTYTKLIAETL